MRTAALWAYTMNDFVLEELISAYLDGELSAEEQSQVERALAENERFRQTHEEFTALRAALQALPRATLDAGFSQRVLAQAQKVAESQALSSSTQETPSSPPALRAETKVVVNSDRASNPLAPDYHGIGQYRKRIFWTAAAAVLVAVLGVPTYRAINALVNGVNTPVADRDRQSDDLNEHVLPEEIVAPLDPAPALADSEPIPDRMEQSPTAPPPSSNGEGPESPTNIARNTSEAPTESGTDTPRVVPRPIHESPTPQIARNSGVPVQPGAARAVRTPKADLVLDYGQPHLHVVRIAVSDEALRNSLLDQALEQAGITFGAAGGRPEQPKLPDEQLPALDTVLVGAAPSQLEQVFATLQKRPEDFHPTHVYPASFERMLDWVLAISDDIINTPPNPKPPGNKAPAADQLANGNQSWDGFLRIAMNTEQRVYAFRAPLDQASIDELFPLPKEPIAPRALRKPVNDDPVQAVFILIRKK